LDSNQQPSD